MKNTLDEMIDIIQSYKIGKQIQLECHGDWIDLEYMPEFNFGESHYRVKPEEPTVTPYQNGEELLLAEATHGPWIQYICKDGVDFFKIYSISPKTKTVTIVFGQNIDDLYTDVTFKNISFQALSNPSIYAWMDGTPCGNVKNKK